LRRSVGKNVAEIDVHACKNLLNLLLNAAVAIAEAKTALQAFGGSRRVAPKRSDDPEVDVPVSARSPIRGGTKSTTSQKTMLRVGLVMSGPEALLRNGSAEAAAAASAAAKAAPTAAKAAAEAAASAAEAHALGLTQPAERAVVELLRGPPEHDVEVGLQLAELRARQRRVLDHDRVEQRRVHRTGDAVARVRFVTFDERLRRDHAIAGLADREVDVRRAIHALQRVFDGLDRAEVVAALRVRQKPAVALEVRIELLALVAALRVQIVAALVRLPDFDERVADRLAGRRQEPPRQVRDLADGRRDLVVDEEQVVIRVERHVVRIERHLGRRSRSQQLRERTGRRERSGPESHTPDHLTTFDVHRALPSQQ